MLDDVIIHCTKSLKYFTQVLVMCLLLSFYIKQAVAIPQLVHALRAHWHLDGLAVLHQSVANSNGTSRKTWRTWLSLPTRKT